MSAEIPLSKGYVALVDDEDYDRAVACGPWHAKESHRTVYAAHGVCLPGRHTRTLRLHHFLTGWRFVDHINGDGLDNRRSNLRRATVGQNNRNVQRRKDNTSGFKGVSLRRRNGQWIAGIRVDGRRIYLGSFAQPDDAAHAYDEAALEHFGEFARLNFPDGVTS